MLRSKRRFYNPNQRDLFEWAHDHYTLLDYPARFIKCRHGVSPTLARLISELAFGEVFA